MNNWEDPNLLVHHLLLPRYRYDPHKVLGQPLWQMLFIQIKNCVQEEVCSVFIGLEVWGSFSLFM